MSLIEAASCSAAFATVSALARACAAAAAAPSADAPVRLAESLIASAVVAIAAVRSPTDSNAAAVSASILVAMPSSAACFSCTACSSCCFWEASRRVCSMAFCLKTATAFAMAPISSRRSAFGTLTDMSPAASWRMVAVIAWMGRVTRRRTSRIPSAANQQRSQHQRPLQRQRHACRPRILRGVSLRHRRCGVGHGDQAVERIGRNLKPFAERHRRVLGRCSGGVHRGAELFETAEIIIGRAFDRLQHLGSRVGPRGQLPNLRPAGPDAALVFGNLQEQLRRQPVRGDPGTVEIALQPGDVAHHPTGLLDRHQLGNGRIDQAHPFGQRIRDPGQPVEHVADRGVPVLYQRGGTLAAWYAQRLIGGAPHLRQAIEAGAQACRWSHHCPRRQTRSQASSTDATAGPAASRNWARPSSRDCSAGSGAASAAATEPAFRPQVLQRHEHELSRCRGRFHIPRGGFLADRAVDRHCQRCRKNQQ